MDMYLKLMLKKNRYLNLKRKKERIDDYSSNEIIFIS